MNKGENIMTSDRSRYEQVFFAEAQEHLQILNDGLLMLEQNPGDHEAVNSVFRAAHTIKGMAATMGYGTITMLTHNLENVLDKVRDGTTQLSPQLSDLLFQGVDLLEGILGDAQAGAEPGPESIAALLEELNRSLSFEQQEPITLDQQEPLSDQVAGTMLRNHEVQVVTEACSRGYGAYFITVHLVSNCLMKAVRVFLVFQRLQAEGEILRAEPPVEDLEEEKFGDSFRLLYISKLDQEAVRHLVAEVTDVVRAEVVRIKTDEHAAPASAGPPVAEKSHRHLTTQTVRIDIHRLDSLMNLVGELVITKTRLEQLLLKHSSSEIEETLKSLSRVAGGLQDAVMKARMVPLAQVFNRFPRMVRDLARELGREVEFTIEGEETELDRSVIDEIGDPLVHLLRNAIDHGIEAPGNRQQKGKSAVGKVRLSAGYEGNHVAIMVEDDGEGIDPQAVLYRAEKKKLISPDQASRLTVEEIYRLLFLPGFSTSKGVSDVSGRGVGLDVVQYKIDSLGGSVEVTSAKDQGTCFCVRLPLTLAIIQALMIETGAETFALPLETVEEIQVLEPTDIKLIRSREVMILRGEVVPLVRLRPLLGCRENTEPVEELSVVVVRGDSSRAGLIVDNLVGQREIVIKSLDRFLGSLPGIGGATILGDGRVALILDPAGILNLAGTSCKRLNATYGAPRKGAH
jgi:two-component system chemotaxis sensor kinase CheA